MPGRGPRSTPGCAPSADSCVPGRAAPIGSVRTVRVLVIGSGAREHALCVALQSDPAVTALACAPGNAGTAVIAAPLPVAAPDPVAVARPATQWPAHPVGIRPPVAPGAGGA